MSATEEGLSVADSPQAVPMQSVNPNMRPTRSQKFHSYVRSGIAQKPIVLFYVIAALFLVMFILFVVLLGVQQQGGAVAMGSLCFILLFVIITIVGFGYVREQTSIKTR
jgi:NADH:ubiquinone oxidoreductase subunit 3 (subunit A)